MVPLVFINPIDHWEADHLEQSGPPKTGRKELSLVTSDEGLLSTTTAHVPSTYPCLHARRQLLPMCLLLLRCQPPTVAHVPAVHCCVYACHCSCTCYLPPAASASPLPPLPLVLLLFLHRLLSPPPASFSSERSDVLCISILPETDQIRTGPAMDQDESGIRNWKPCIYFFFLSSIR